MDYLMFGGHNTTLLTQIIGNGRAFSSQSLVSTLDIEAAAAQALFDYADNPPLHCISKLLCCRACGHYSWALV